MRQSLENLLVKSLVLQYQLPYQQNGLSIPKLEYDLDSEPYDEMTVKDFIDMKKPITFIYDYGDIWQHKVVLESVEDYDPR